MKKILLFGMLDRIIASKSKTFFVSCLSFLFGITVATRGDGRIPAPFIFGFLLGLVILLMFHWQRIRFRFFVFCLFFFCIGIVRYAVAIPMPSSEHISFYNGTYVSLVGLINKEPDIRPDATRYRVFPNQLWKGGGEEPIHSLKGFVLIEVPRYPSFQYGDVFRINCRLETPEPFDGFRYDRYLARDGIFSICRDAEIEKIFSGSGSAVMGRILFLKQKMTDRVALLWHEPYASFVSGVLYGYRGGLGELQEDFNRTGVSHIVAISGYNIMIVGTAIIWLCISLWIPRKRAFFLVTFAIVLFVIFTGASASVVRAGVMAILVLSAHQFGRVARMGNVLVFAASLMILHNPFVLWYDAGFQLSFLATMGLVYLTPLVRPWFRWMPSVFGFRETTIATIAAIIATLPLMLYHFGRFSIVAPLVNVAILWVIPGIMLLGFTSVMTSLVLVPLGDFFATLAWIAMEYCVRIVRLFSHLPFAAIVITVPAFFVALLYAALLWWVCQSSSQKKYA